MTLPLLATFALALLVGGSLGLLGGGGSILMVPVLLHVLHQEPKVAIATSLAVVGAASLAGMVGYARRGLVHFRTGLVFGAAGMIGAYGGGRIAAHVPDAVLLWLFSALLVVTAVAMLRKRPAEDGAPPTPTARPLAKIVIDGLVVGAVTGLVGAGGGFLVVPALVLFGGLSMPVAIGTSLFVIALKAFAGFLGYVSHVGVDVGLTAGLAGLAALGTLLGARLSARLKPETLRTGFGLFVLAVGAAFTVDLVKDLAGTRAYELVFVSPWPWWVSGSLIALVVVGFLLADNRLLGVSTGFEELCQRNATLGALRRSWRPSFLAGILLGGVVAGALAAKGPTTAMGSLDDLVGGSLALKGLLLGSGGVLLGLGSRLAGGCTSGHGLVGVAQGARSSLLALGMFMVGGVLTTQLLRWAVG